MMNGFLFIVIELTKSPLEKGTDMLLQQTKPPFTTFEAKNRKGLVCKAILLPFVGTTFS